MHGSSRSHVYLVFAGISGLVNSLNFELSKFGIQHWIIEFSTEIFVTTQPWIIHSSNIALIHSSFRAIHLLGIHLLVLLLRPRRNSVTINRLCSATPRSSSAVEGCGALRGPPLPLHSGNDEHIWRLSGDSLAVSRELGNINISLQRYLGLQSLETLPDSGR